MKDTTRIWDSICTVPSWCSFKEGCFDGDVNKMLQKILKFLFTAVSTNKFLKFSTWLIDWRRVVCQQLTDIIGWIFSSMFFSKPYNIVYKICLKASRTPNGLSDISDSLPYLPKNSKYGIKFTSSFQKSWEFLHKHHRRLLANWKQEDFEAW